MIGANIIINKFKVKKLRFYNNKEPVQKYNILGNKIFIVGNIIEKQGFLKEKLKEIIISNKHKELLNFNGEFFIFILKEKKEIIIVNSKSSYVPIFYTYKTKNLNIRSNILDFKKKFYKNINYNKIFSWLIFNGRSFDNKTFLKEIKTLNPGDICTISPIKFKFFNSDNFNYVEKKLSLNQSINNVIDSLKKAINERIGSVKGNISFGLSGGLDSRILLSLIDKKYKKRILTHTYGDKNNFESIVAKKISRKLGFKHKFFEIKKKEYYHLANHSVKNGSFQTVFKNGVKTKYTKKIIKYDKSKFLIMGNALDVLIASSFSKKGIKKVKNINSYISWYKKNFLLFKPDEIKNFFKNSKINYKKEIDNVIKNYFKKSTYNKNYINFNDALTFETRIKKWHNPSLAQQSRIVNFLIPTYDKFFLNACSNISSKYRYNDYFRKKLMQKINLKIAKIPTTDEMIKSFNGHQFKKQYYDTNLGIDMKNNNEFVKFYNNIKIRFEASIFKKKLKLSYLNFLVNEHRSGIKDNTRKIFMCITLLIILINISNKSV